MDLYEDIRQHVLTHLPHRPEDRAELEAKRVDELLILYLNWRSRYVTPRPRTLHGARRQPLGLRPDLRARHRAHHPPDRDGRRPKTAPQALA